MKATELRSAAGIKTSRVARRAIVAAAVLGVMSGAQAVKAVDLFWDQDGDTTTAVGGTGNWLGGSTWRPTSPTGTPLQAWADTNDAHFPGAAVTSAGGTITLTGPVSANSVQFDTGTTTLSGAQTLTLGAGGINILGVGTHTINSNLTVAGGLNYGRSQGLATNFTRLTLSGTNNFGGAINWNSSTAIGTGAQHRIEVTAASAIPSNTVLNFQTTQSQFQIGTTLASTDIVLNGAIHLNALNTGTTLNQYLGSNGSATLQNRLIINGAVDGQAHLNFLAQNGGGGGEFLLNSAMTYTGDTLFNTVTATGHARWGINNALPTTTNLTVGATTGSFGTGALDLKGFNQTVNSLKTGSGTTGFASAGIVNTGANLSTVTITGLAGGPLHTTYASSIGTPSVTTNLSGTLDNIALVLASTHTGSLTLTRQSFYTGGTTVNGGGLIANNNPLDGSATGLGPVNVNAGGSVGGTGRINGAVTLGAGNAAVNPGGLANVEDLQLDNGLTLASGNILNYDFAPALNDKLMISGNLSLPAAADVIDINLNDLGGLVNGTYQLISYSGSLVGAFNSLSVGTAPGGATYTLLNNPNSIDLQVVGAANIRTWVGGGTPTPNLWDHNGSTNWSGAGNKFINGDQVVFDDTGSNTTITVAGAGVSPGQMSFTNNGATYTFSGGSIGGTGSLTKTGSGTVILNNSNTFTGAVNLGGGTLVISSGNAIGGASLVNFSNNAILQASGAITTNKPMSIGSGGGTIDTNGNAFTTSGALSGSGLLTKAGAGTLSLTAATTGYSGEIQINAGTVRVNSVTGSDNTTGAGTGIVRVNSGGTFHIDNITMGTSTAAQNANVILDQGGATLLASGNSWYGKSGGFTVQAGIGVVNVNTVNASDLMVFKNTVRRVGSGAGPLGSTIRIGGPGRVLIESGAVSAANTFSGTWDVASGILQLGPVDPLGFGESLNGPGFLDGNPMNGTTVTVSGGTLAGAVNTPNPASSAAATTPNFFRAGVVMSGGTLASVGLNSAWGGDFATTAATTSQVLVADAVTAGQARDVNLVAGTAVATFNNAASTSWAGTLVVTPGSLVTGGAFNIARDGGTVDVTAGAVLQINSGATVNLSGTANILTDGTDSVNIVNNGRMNVVTGTKRVGVISGTTGKTDIKANKMILGNAPGTASGGNYTAGSAQRLVQTGLNGGAWDGPGIITSEPDALNNLTTVAIATGEQARGLGPTDTALFGGQTINGTSVLAMYTYAGDLNLDGEINADDYASIDFNAPTAGASGYYNGDINYDGAINADDYATIDFNNNAQGAPFPTSGDAGLAGVTAVPEPASFGLLAVAGSVLLGKRRRRA